MIWARWAFVACCGFLCLAQAVMAGEQVVLVADAKSPLHDLDSLELRKIYLGYPVWHDARIVKGLRNTGDRNLNRIFHQTVVAMSEKSYERRLLAMTLREGIPRPPEYNDTESLARALLQDPYSVSYMWKATADQLPQIKILSVLWQKY